MQGMTEARSVLLVGATGLVGGLALDLLLASPRAFSVTVLARRATGRTHARLRERIIDLDAPIAPLEGHDAVLCALGTTIKKAGSPGAFRRVDHDMPLRVAEAAHAGGSRAFALVSSVGAAARSGSFYLRTKGELEEALRKVGFASLSLLRPSFLMGQRAEDRPGERLGIAAAKVASGLMVLGLRRYRGIDADVVARALVAAGISAEPGVHVAEYDALTELALSL
jgi:uncharacterized protein YbjT (DUF2867 family)